MVSHALRHEPWLYALEMDEEGWVPVDQLLMALREKRDLASVDRLTLERMLASAAKQRHELVGDRIRALYGHSLPRRIPRRPATPPPRLFHGTAAETWGLIELDGLLPMRRQDVHLSVDRETARLVAMRQHADPLTLEVDAAAAASAGVAFYQGNELVWLAGSIPSQFIAVS